MTQQVEDRTQVRRRRWRDDWPVAVAAAGAAAAVWVAADLAGVDLAVRSGSGTQHVGLASAIITALVVAMAAAGLLRLLERRTPRALAIWTAIAGAVWVVSFSGPLGARSLSAGLSLAAMHLAVGAVIVVGLRRRRVQELA